MGKLWGYSKKQESRLSGMLAKQTIRRRRRKHQVLMKLPKVFDMQRLVLAKHLARITRYPVHCAKMVDPDFEDKVEAFKKNRPSSSRAIVRSRHATLRKDRERNGPSEEGGGGQELETSHVGGFDFHKMSYSSGFLKFCTWDLRKEVIRSKDELAEEDWQRRNWRTPFIRDQISEAMNEVYAMNRKVTQSCRSVWMCQHPYTMILESAHYALKIRDWPKLALSISGLLHLVGGKQFFRFPDAALGTPTVLWMHGLLALVNHHKESIQAVKQYAECLKSMFIAYPIWLGVHAATWLIQKGYFIDGYAVLTEQFKLPPTARYNLKFRKTANMKRNQANFVEELVYAVKLYCEWRKESTLLLEGHDQTLSVDGFHSLVDSIRRQGEAALTAFEVLYEMQKVTRADVMCFLEPFIELVVKYRSPNRALEILQELNYENDGNLVVEEFLVQFVGQYANTCDISKDYISQLQERLQVKSNPGDQSALFLKRLKAKRQIKAMRIATKKTGFVRTFTKIENPSFSC